MTRVYDDPAQFTEDMLTGFTELHAGYLVSVPGGVVRRTGRPGKVAVVVGGGSGHYPAFCGVVGPGFADGAVVGNIFTSPSAADAASVGRAADAGAGVLLITGNYAGDVMNFTLAASTLGSEGVDARFVVVTDDIASAPPAEAASRRGIAGGFVVYKAASAAAEEGYTLDGVERVAELANDRTRSLGVAFDGCTLPGADGPMFSVPAGRMALGLGIHGEPGIAEEALPTASALAARLVGGVLADRPGGTDTRVAVLLNGLGRTKYEELFILWAHVARLLRQADLDLVEPEVGELVTSLDMAGCSLTVTWLDGELERLWRAPADSPAYKKGQPASMDSQEERRPHAAAQAAAAPPAGLRTLSDLDRACAVSTVAALEAMAAAMERMAAELGDLDSVAGDGDHGRGMVRGTQAALEAGRAAQKVNADPGEVLITAGRAWADKAGGTSGVLWGAALDALGGRLSGSSPVTGDQLAAGVSEAYDAVARLGRAVRGDKTMLDALGPFSDALDSGIADHQPLAEAWGAASAKADVAARDTAALRPRVGRARPLAERSIGVPDPGAVSLAACLKAVGDVLQVAHESKE
jgi:dihydroxyacetone kinase